MRGFHPGILPLAWMNCLWIVGCSMQFEVKAMAHGEQRVDLIIMRSEPFGLAVGLNFNYEHPGSSRAENLAVCCRNHEDTGLRGGEGEGARASG